MRFLPRSAAWTSKGSAGLTMLTTSSPTSRGVPLPK